MRLKGKNDFLNIRKENNKTYIENNNESTVHMMYRKYRSIQQQQKSTE